eukprot:gene19380-25248_t
MEFMIVQDFHILDNPTTGCVYSYEITGITDPSITESGDCDDGSFTFEPTTTGEFQLSVDEICSDVVTKSTKKTMYSKYVRREITALSEDDREEFLDAFSTLWKVSTIEGQELYGENYKSLYHFALVHNDAGEQVMRLVNPKVSLHYMEYGTYFSSSDYAKHQENQLDGGAWSELFTEKYFGSNDPYTGKITTGRWADLSLPYITEDFLLAEGISPSSTFFQNEETEWLSVTGPHITNPYGLLRGPWNYSPANYTLRFMNVNLFNDYENVESAITNYYDGVDCDDYSSFVDLVSGQSLYTLLSVVEDDVHGKVHFTLGGSGGTHCVDTDKYLMDTYGFEWKDMIVVAQSSQRFFKEVIGTKDNWEVSGLDMVYPLECSENPWEDGYLSTKYTAGPGEEGGPSCTCNSYYFEDPDKLLQLINTYFSDWVGSDSVQSETLELIYGLSFEQQVDVMTQLCGRFQLEGDLTGSGAATDPIFWVVHGGVERLMQKIYFDGILTDYDYFEGNNNMCSGHLQFGMKDWLEGYKFQDTSIEAQFVTNDQLAAYLNPLSDLYRDQIDFVYDHNDWDTICSGELF